MCEPEQGTLCYPIDRQTTYASKALTRESNGLYAVQDCGDDVGGEKGQPEQHSKVAGGETKLCGGCLDGGCGIQSAPRLVRPDNDLDEGCVGSSQIIVTGSLVSIAHELRANARTKDVVIQEVDANMNAFDNDLTDSGSNIVLPRYCQESFSLPVTNLRSDQSFELARWHPPFPELRSLFVMAAHIIAVA